MSVFSHVLVLAIHLGVIFSEMPVVQKCKLSDPACLKAQAQAAIPAMAAGIPEIGSEPLDVMHIDTIKVDLAGLNLDLRDVEVKGLRKAVIDKIIVDMDMKIILLSWDTDILLKGRYKASGQLLILPISGDGDIIIKLRKLHIDMTIPFEMSKNEEGKDMMDLKSYKYKFDIKENANFQLTNLFNGNKVLSDIMLNFMNENWKILSNEFGGVMIEKPNKKIYSAIKKYLGSQPMENIFDY